jgi:MFS family permease
MISRSALACFAIVFFGALALYVGTAAPSLTWAHSGADGGDLITAAFTNGVPHPPGYPTYITLGQIMARLPIGDVAYRFNLFSAVCMALAAGFTTLSILQMMPSTLPRFVGQGVAMVASLFFVAAPMVWGQATIAEVHALNACFVALIVHLIAPIVFRGEAVSLARLTLAAWLWGAAFGNLITVAALVPLMIVAWWRGWRVNNSPYKFMLPIVAFLAGLSVYALIPLRAAQQPPVNWGDATSLDRFIALITAEMYRGYTLSTPPAELFARLIAFAQLVVTQYGWLGVILATLGLYHALISSNKNWRWLAATIGFYLLFALTYSAADSALYLIPVWMFGAWAISRGLLTVSRHPSLVTRHLSSLFLLLAFLFGPLLNIWIHLPAMNLRNDHSATEFANAILTAAPSQAIVITDSDGQTFALWYHRHVAGQRPDLAIIDRRLAGYPGYDTMLRAQGSAPLLPDDDPPETWIDRMAQLNGGRVLCIVNPESAQMSC